MRNLLTLLVLTALAPAWAEEKPVTEDLKPFQVACDVQVDVLKAKTAALEARLQSLRAYVELLKTEQGQRYAFLEDQGNQLLTPLQAALDKAQASCAEGLKFDMNSLTCKKPEPPPPSDPAASAP